MNSQDVTDQFDITYRQLDHWTRKGYLGAGVKSSGQGRSRDYSNRELLTLETMLGLVKAGVKPDVASAVALGDSAAYSKLKWALEGARASNV